MTRVRQVGGDVAEFVGFLGSLGGGGWRLRRRCRTEPVKMSGSTNPYRFIAPTVAGPQWEAGGDVRRWLMTAGLIGFDDWRLHLVGPSRP